MSDLGLLSVDTLIHGTGRLVELHFDYTIPGFFRSVRAGINEFESVAITDEEIGIAGSPGNWKAVVSVQNCAVEPEENDGFGEMVQIQARLMRDYGDSDDYDVDFIYSVCSRFFHPFFIVNRTFAFVSDSKVVCRISYLISTR